MKIDIVKIGQCIVYFFAMVLGLWIIVAIIEKMIK